MTNYHKVDRPPVLAHAEIEKLLSMRLIANLATIGDDGGIHIVPMWFLRVAEDIYFSQYTQVPRRRKIVGRVERFVRNGKEDYKNN